MKVSVYGAGYVGLITAACLAKLGHQVICADINQDKIDQLNKGQCPIYEDSLPDLLKEQLEQSRLYFTGQLDVAIQAAEIHFIATGTPCLPDGSADLTQVFNVVDHIIAEIKKDGLLVIKSTVPVGTGDKIKALIEQQSLKARGITLNVASNPEFLREGSAVYDFFSADRIIIGAEEPALAQLEALYHPLVIQGVPLLKMSQPSAELVKYASNVMLACKISCINYFSQLAESLNADVEEIREGLSLDHRIGPHFLQAGIGYGGSCFPKDLKALKQLAQALEIDSSILEAIESINQKQKNWVFEHLSKHFAKRPQKLKGLKIAIWGLAFKPGTDDMREASSLMVVSRLLEAGVHLSVYDPIALPAAKKLWGESSSITWCNSAGQVFEPEVDALVILTEWDEFKKIDLAHLKIKLKNAPLIDGRNCFNLKQAAESELTYYSVGRPTVMVTGQTVKEGHYYACSGN